MSDGENSNSDVLCVTAKLTSYEENIIEYFTMKDVFMVIGDFVPELNSIIP